MGGEMASHIHKNGLDLTVWNRSQERRQPLIDLGVAFANSLNDLGQSSDIVCLCVSKSEDVLDCLEQLTASARPGTLFVDHSTISPAVAEQIHLNLSNRGLRFIDAPITGGSMGAKNGTLTIFCGGEGKDIEESEPVLKCYGKTVERVGGPGAGQRMKAANQIAVGGALLALCESLSFAQKCGLDLAQTRRLLSGGAAGSWAFENYGPKVLNRDWTPGFSIDNQVKDFGYCEETAEGIGAAIPGTMLVHDLLVQMQAEGQGALTTCALFDLMMRMDSDVQP
jgi:3-hydroxyisobutyrate dehydrogenase-like beta-hydroxyacid dehydrogenase